MNTIIEFFQGLAAQVPDLLQPLIIAAAGAIPFIEGEVSSVIGVWAGLNPIVAGLAGAIGNFICVAVIVLLGARARRAVVARRDQKRATARSVVTPSGDTIAEAGPSDIRTADHLGAGDDLHPDLNPDLDSDLHSDTHPDLHSDLHSDTDSDTDEALTATTEKPDSKGRIKFKRFLTRFGVPGASLLGPLAIPTQITSTILVSAGVKTSWILLWQGIAIVAWTTLTTAIATGALTLIAG